MRGSFVDKQLSVRHEGRVGLRRQRDRRGRVPIAVDNRHGEPEVGSLRPEVCRLAYCKSSRMRREVFWTMPAIQAPRIA